MNRPSDMNTHAPESNTPRAERRTKKQRAITTMPSKIPQPHGGALHSGGTPGNTGGKPGRSGRKPDEFKRRLEQIRDERGLATLEAILNGYTLRSACAQCGQPSSDQLGDLVPTIEARLRAAELTMRYTIGLTKTIKLDGVRGVAEAFERIRSRIRASLAPEAAERLISDISDDLRGIR
jgi:hypothetical protein